MAALFCRVYLAQAQAHRPGRGAACHCHLHSFRFFGLVFILPGIVGPQLPATFATFAAYGDFATGVLAMLALLAVRRRALFWPLVVTFNVVGMADILLDYWHAIQVGLPAVAGELGATYPIAILYVPALMITHIAAVYLLVRDRTKPAQTLAGGAAAIEGS